VAGGLLFSTANITARGPTKCWGALGPCLWFAANFTISKIFARKQLCGDLYYRLIAFRVVLPALRVCGIRDREPSRLRGAPMTGTSETPDE